MKPNRNLSIASKYIDKQILVLEKESEKLITKINELADKRVIVLEQIEGLKKQQEYLIGEPETV